MFKRCLMMNEMVNRILEGEDINEAIINSGQNIYEMARVGNIRTQKLKPFSVWIHPSNDRAGAYFKVINEISWDKHTRSARFDFRTGEFIKHKPESTIWLNFSNKEKKALIDWFKTTSPIQIDFKDSEGNNKRTTFTRWQATIFQWNTELGYADDMDFNFEKGCSEDSYLLQDNCQRGKYVPLDIEIPEFNA